MSATPLMDDARAKTKAFVSSLSDAQLVAWPDPTFSPLCWHLGHVAFTEAHWALARCANDSSWSAPHARRFAQDGCKKSERSEGYDRQALFAYLDEVRAAVHEGWSRIAPHDLAEQGYLDWFLACHEHQHRETMALVLAMTVPDHGEAFEQAAAQAKTLRGEGCAERTFGGTQRLGSDARCVYDNEKSAFDVELQPFALAEKPVRAFEWHRFIQDGGYATRSLWSDAGWAFCQRLGRKMPRAWRQAGDGYVELTWRGPRALSGEEAVSGVSFFEANAFAKWAGAALPTEDEWEFAARASQPDCDPWCGGGEGPRAASSASGDMLGNVWEWTSTLFAPRPGFEPFPYRGYSQPYFDDAHYVLRGGSFATDPAIARPGFRNWYHPQTRQLFCGLRLKTA